MWDRFRAGTSAVAGAGAGADVGVVGAGPYPSGGSGGGVVVAAPPSWPGSGQHHDNPRRQQHQQYEQYQQHKQNPQSSVSRSNNTWQPRSSVIGQQHYQRQPQQQRSASGDIYGGAASGTGYGVYGGYGTCGGQGSYQYSIKGGAPPSSRPPKNL